MCMFKHKNIVNISDNDDEPDNIGEANKSSIFSWYTNLGLTQGLGEDILLSPPSVLCYCILLYYVVECCDQDTYYCQAQLSPNLTRLG